MCVENQQIEIIKNHRYPGMLVVVEHYSEYKWNIGDAFREMPKIFQCHDSSSEHWNYVGTCVFPV